MMRKLAKIGYRVQPMYSDGPQGTISFVVNDYYVCVLWDGDEESKREPIKFLRKGFSNDADVTPGTSL